MFNKSKEYLIKEYQIRPQALELHDEAMKAVQPLFQEYEEIREYNQFKVLKAFQDEKISDYHFTNTTGYGYGDIGSLC